MKIGDKLIMIKKFCKSILAFILALSFVVGLFPVMSVRAADPYGKVDQKINYKFVLDLTQTRYNYSLKEGYTDEHKFEFYNSFITKKGNISALCISLYTMRSGSCDMRLENEKGKVIFERKECPNDFHKIVFLNRDNYILKIRAREDTCYRSELSFDCGDRVYVDSVNFLGSKKEATLKSPVGKVTWYKETYNEKTEKRNYKKIKTAKTLKITDKEECNYVFEKNGIKFIYYVDKISPFNNNNQNYTAEYLSAGCNIGLVFFPDETTPYYVRLNGYNNSKKTITKITVKADDVIYTQKDLIRPYECIDFIKGKKGEKAHYLQKVVYTYSDGTKETIFNGEQYIFNVSEV